MTGAERFAARMALAEMLADDHDDDRQLRADDRERFGYDRAERAERAELLD